MLKHFTRSSIDFFSEVRQYHHKTLVVSKIFEFIFVSGVACKKSCVAYNYIAKDMWQNMSTKWRGKAIKCRTIPLMHYQPLPC